MLDNTVMLHLNFRYVNLYIYICLLLFFLMFIISGKHAGKQCS